MLRRTTFLHLCVLAVIVSASSVALAQSFTSADRGTAQDMLNNAYNEVRKHYYDPNIHGLDWEGIVAATKEKIKTATTYPQAISLVAAALDKIDDSHTFLLPPVHAVRLDYGWEHAAFGNQCLIVRVRPGTDAEKKLKPGDEILTINGLPAARQNLWRLHYMFDTLRPQPGLHLEVKSPDGAVRQVDVVAKTRQTTKVRDLGNASDFGDYYRTYEADDKRFRVRYAEFGDDLVIAYVPEFNFSEAEVDRMVGKARKHKALIIDLRGNYGGSELSLRLLVAGFLDKEVKIADRIAREDRYRKPVIARHRSDPFTGKLIILVDSRSASAAELFAREMQIEKRGTVLGDLTSGMVMEAVYFGFQAGAGTVTPYGLSITRADLIMSDGKSLEKRGVTPDEYMVPTAEDLSKSWDTVLSHAAEEAGVKLSPADAFKLFPYEWPPE